MFIDNGDGTYDMGPADIICIFKLPAGTYHMVVLEEKPLPGPVEPLEKLPFLRLKSTMHHTIGATTLEGAQEHIAGARQKWHIDDANVVSDVALDVEDRVCVFPVRNWIREKIPLKEALGIR